MFRSLILLFAVVAPLTAQSPKAPEFTEKVLPFLDEQTLVVARLDLSRVQLDPFIGLVAVLNEGGNEEMADAVKTAKAWLAEFARKGGRDVFITYGASDFPNVPCLLIPIGESPEQRKDLGELMKLPFGEDDEVLIEKLHGCMAVGKKNAITVLKARKAVKRPDLLEALEAGKDEPLQIAIAFTEDAKKIHEQVAPLLPDELGGGSITKFTRGLKWTSLSVGPAPSFLVRWTVMASNPEALKEIGSTQELIRKQGANLITGNLPESVAAQQRLKIEKGLASISSKTDGLKHIDEWELGEVLKEFKKELPPAPAVGRMQSVNNLKQLMLALHNYHDVNGHFPTDIVSKEGKPLLSWRVHLLPYIEQSALYQRFKLNEPWDSENNKPLSETVVKLFVSPRQNAAKNMTTYLAPLGEGYMWDQPKGVKITDVPDGTSNTIMLLEADDESAVIWSKPGDLKIDPAKPMKNLLGHYTDGFQAAFADGSVRYIKKTLRTETLIALLTRGGGEVISDDGSKDLPPKELPPMKK
ncbi:DUF1559 family PulG-like putative transporter [Zavarzinella formosa]|uniref:DUF1559 family PulG-like putative transporter n=1 Tax=Zavarzinella formosa TaxID=360055 RepID=UPI00030D4B72|nr:DUF1559 domain-containing protein [Zavarzinella formosa]